MWAQGPGGGVFCKVDIWSHLLASSRQHPRSLLEKRFSLGFMLCSLYPAHQSTTWVDNVAQWSPDVAGLKVLHPRKSFSPGQTGTFGDPHHHRSLVWGFPWSEGWRSALAGPGWGGLWPSLQWPLSCLPGIRPSLQWPLSCSP